jgi:hypothetical protein
MTIPLEYNLSVIGQRDVDRAFLALEQRVAQHVKRVEQITGLHGRGGAGGVANDRSSASGIRSAARLEAEATRAAAREARARAKNEEQWENYTRTIKDRRLREDEKRERQQTKTHEQEAKKRARTEDQLRKSSERAALRSAHDAGAARMGFARSVGGTLGAIGSSGLALTGLSGGAMAANAIHDQARVGGMATELAGKIVGKGGTVQKIRQKQIELLAQSGMVKGFSQEAILGIAGSYGGITGDYAGGMGMASDIAKLSAATGGDPSEMAQVAGNASMSLSRQFSGEELRKRVMQTTRMFAGQGEMGAVEIKDLAKYAGRLTAPAAQYAGDKEANFISLGTMAQVARGSGSAASAEEATTAVARFQNDIIDKRSELKKLGVDIFDAKSGKLRAPDQLVADIMEKTGGSIVKTNDIFGQMSAKTVAGFSNIYQAGEAQQKGGGRAAVMAEFERFKGATLSAEDVTTRADALGQGQGAAFTESMKKLNVAIGKELLPVVTDLTQRLGNAAPEIGRFSSAVASSVAYLADNPYKGIGAIVLGAIGKEIAVAGIGTAVQAACAAAAGGAVAAIGGVIVAGLGSFFGTTAVLSSTDNSGDINKQLTSIGSDVNTQMQLIDRSNASPTRKYDMKRELLTGAMRETGDAVENRSFSAMLGGAGTKQGEAMTADFQAMLSDAFMTMIKSQNDASSKISSAADKIAGSNRGSVPSWFGPGSIAAPEL